MTTRTLIIILFVTLIIGAALSFFITREFYRKDHVVVAPADSSQRITIDSLTLVLTAYSDSIKKISHEIEVLRKTRVSRITVYVPMSWADRSAWIDRYRARERLHRNPGHSF